MEGFDLGTYSRAVSTRSPEAQRWFDIGLNWCYGFNHEEAIRCFEKVLSFDPGLGERLRAVYAHLGTARDAQLVYRGQEPLSGAPGWRLLFDPVSEDDAAGNYGTASSPGQLIELHAQAVAAGAAVLPSGACAIDADGAAVVWVHRAPERFAPLRLQSCASGIALQPGGVQLAQGDRLVTQGAGLLSQYR